MSEAQGDQNPISIFAAVAAASSNYAAAHPAETAPATRTYSTFRPVKQEKQSPPRVPKNEVIQIDDSDEEKRKKKKRKHKRDSSSDSGSRRKSHKDKKVKKQKHRSRSKDRRGGGDLNAEQLNTKWSILKNFLDFRPALHFKQLVTIDCQPKHDVFHHEQINKLERIEYKVRRVAIAPKHPVVDDENLKIYAAKIYGIDNTRKTFVRYHDRSISYSKAPENVFEKLSNADLDVIPLSARYKPIHSDNPEQFETKIKKEEGEEEVEEDERDEGGPTITVPVLQKELTKIKGAAAKIKYLTETIEQRSKFLKHAREENRNSERKYLEELWQQRIYFEDLEHERAAASARMLTTDVVATEQQYNEIKLAKLKRADQVLSNSFLLFEEMVKIQRRGMELRALNALFESKKAVFAADPRFWNSWLDALLYDIKLYNQNAVMKVFHDSVRILRAIIDKQYNVARRNHSDEELNDAILSILGRYLHFLVHSGQLPRAVAFSQAILSFIFTPKNLNPNQLGTAASSAMLKNFEEYWLSGVARVGDENAILWHDFRPSMSADVQEPELYRERKAVDAEMLKSAREFMQKSNVLSLWPLLERIQEKFSWRPIRVLDKVDEESRELDRYVAFSDLSLPTINVNLIMGLSSEIISVFGGQISNWIPSLESLANQIGGFSFESHLPEGIADFIDRLLASCCQSYMNDNEKKQWFFISRFLSRLENLSFQNIALHEKVAQLLTICEDQMASTVQHVMISLSIHSAVSRWYLFQDVYSRYENSVPFLNVLQQFLARVPQRPTTRIFEMENFDHLTLELTLILAIIRIFRHPLVTKWLCVKLTTPDFALSSFADLQNIPMYCKNENISGVQYLRALDEWKKNKPKFEQIGVIATLRIYGVCHPFALYHVLLAHFAYAAGVGFDTERVSSVKTTFLNSFQKANFSDEDRELLLVELLELYEYHNLQFRNVQQQRSEILRLALTQFPLNITFWRLQCEDMISRPFSTRNDFSQQLKRDHEIAVAERNVVKSRVLAIVRAYFARRQFEKVAFAEDQDRYLSGWAMKIGREYESIALTQREPFIWRLALLLHIQNNDSKSQKNTYTRAVQSCVWSRALHLTMASNMEKGRTELVERLMAEMNVPTLVSDLEVEAIVESITQTTSNDPDPKPTTENDESCPSEHGKQSI